MPPPLQVQVDGQSTIYESMGAPSPSVSADCDSEAHHGLHKDEFYSEQRQTPMGPAVFALVNTVVGGGVLSLPYSFQLAGSLVGVLILGLSCVATGFTLFCLISASRRTNARTFEDVMKAAFGTPAQVLVVVLVMIITFLTPVAYLILLRELVTPILEAYVVGRHRPLSRLTQDIITGGIAVVVTPLTSLRSIGALGSLAAFSMASILVLAGTVLYRSLACVSDAPSMPRLPLANPDPASILSSVPVFVCCFLCHFNVLPVFTELRHPTRHRGNTLVQSTMASTGVLYLAVGLSGYAYGLCRTGSVRDNVLSSFPSDDGLVNVARGALTIVLCFCYPLLLMPCRDSLIRLYQIIYACTRRRCLPPSLDPSCHDEESGPLRAPPRRHFPSRPSCTPGPSPLELGDTKDQAQPLLTPSPPCPPLHATNSPAPPRAAGFGTFPSSPAPLTGETDGQPAASVTFPPIGEENHVAAAGGTEHRDGGTGDEDEPSRMPLLPAKPQPQPTSLANQSATHGSSSPLRVASRSPAPPPLLEHEGSEATVSSPSSSQRESPAPSPRRPSPLSLLMLSYSLTAVVVVLASAVDSVAVMWQIMGSFACITVAFICPPAAYIKVCNDRQVGKRRLAWLVLVGGVFLALLCVTQTVLSLLHD